MASRLVVTFTGSNGIGAITSITGLKTGDELLHVLPISGPPGTALGSDSSPVFSSFAASDGEIFQSSPGNFSAVTFAALCQREEVN